MTQARDVPYWERKTMTGLSLKEVYAKIDEDMGPRAYSAVTGTGKALTDIKPPFVYELLTECFGMAGDGWGYDLVDSEYIGFQTKHSETSNRDYDLHDARARVILWYIYLDDEGGAAKCTLGEMVGGSSNETRQYAEQGAITNAIGKGLSMLGVQRHIYKNETPDGQPAPDPSDDFTLPFDFDGRSKGETLRGIAKDGDLMWLTNFGANYGINKDGSENPKFAAKNKKARALADKLVAELGGGEPLKASPKEPVEKPDLLTEAQSKLVHILAKAAGVDEETLHAGIKQSYGVEHVSDLSKKQVDQLIERLEKAKAAKKLADDVAAETAALKGAEE